MESEEGPSQLLNSLMKEVNEQQWETFKKSRKSGDLVISEWMSEDESSEEESNVELSISSDISMSNDPKQFLQAIIDNNSEDLEFELLQDLDETDSDLQLFEDKKLKSEEKATSPMPKKRKKMRRSKLPKQLIGLVGEANLCFARGAHDDAIAMCLEVIRQAPTASEPFQTLGMIFSEKCDHEKAYQYNLIAAYLSPSDEDQWVKVADMAVELENYKQAIICLGKAIKLNPKSIDLQLQRCQLLEKIGHSDKALDGFQNLLASQEPENGEAALYFAKEIARIHFANNQIGNSLKVMESTFTNYHSFITSEDVNVYLDLLIAEKMYLKSLKLLHDQCGIQFKINDYYLNDFELETWSKLETQLIEIELPFEVLPVDLRAKLIICLISMNCIKSVKKLLKPITDESAEEMVDLYLDIADAYSSNGFYVESEPLLAALISTQNFKSCQVWLKYARCLQNLSKFEESIIAYQEAIRNSSNSHEAKIELTNLLIMLNRNKDAATVSCQDESEAISLDLLKLRCNLLYQQEMWKDFVCAAKLLLSNVMHLLKTDKELDVVITHNSCKRRIWESLRDLYRGMTEDEIEKTDFIGGQLKFDDFLDIYLKLCSVLKYQLNDKEELIRIALSTFTSCFYDSAHQSYLEFYAIMALYETKDSKYSYPLIKSLIAKDTGNNQLWNLFCPLVNNVFQDLRHNKFCLRLFVKHPDNIALAYYNAHNSLISGSYKHALGEYVNIHKQNPTDPLPVLCIAIGFMHLAYQKFTSNRHAVMIQMCAFLDLYIKLRGECQESLYNAGRAFHQLGLLNDAIHFYKKALTLKTNVDTKHKDMDQMSDNCYDLSREIAFNLALIYKNSGSDDLALYYIRKEFVV